MESLYAELVSNGALVRPHPAHVQDYIGAAGYVGATLERAGIIPDPSMAQARRGRRVLAAPEPGAASRGRALEIHPLASPPPPSPRLSLGRLGPFGTLQIRQALCEYAILPLGAASLHARLPYTRALLLAGAPKTGKTLLTHVRCRGGGRRFKPSQASRFPLPALPLPPRIPSVPAIPTQPQTHPARPAPRLWPP
jgi:hypothetical protein